MPFWDKIFDVGKKIIGPIVGGLFDQKGASDQNQASSAEAQKNRAFQERMSNSAYQRATIDMKKAGLNRILAVKQGASTTPGGGMAPMVNTMTGPANSARVVATQIANIANIEANTRKTDTDRDFKAKELEILNTTGKSPVGDVLNTVVSSAKAAFKTSKTYGQTLREPEWAAKARAKRKADLKNFTIPKTGAGRRKMVRDWWNQ